MNVLFYFLSNLILMLVVYLILFDFDVGEPLFADDNLDSVGKTLITEVMVIEDYIVLEQIRNLVLRIFIAYYDKRMINSLYFLDNPSKIHKNKNIHNFPYFLLRHGMNPRSWCLHHEGIHPDTPYYLHSGQGILIL